MNEILDTPVTHSDPVKIILKLLDPQGSRVVGQGSHRCVNSMEGISRNAIEFPLSSRGQDELVGHLSYRPEERRSAR